MSWKPFSDERVRRMYRPVEEFQAVAVEHPVFVVIETLTMCPAEAG